MADRTQNYMTNRLIKETVDKNQKDYQEPEEESASTTADVFIKAQNSSNENIENCVVTLTKDNDVFTGTTDSKGEYTIKNVPFGTYQVLATASPYEEVEQQFTVEESNNNLIITFTKQTFEINGPTFEETEEEGFF